MFICIRSIDFTLSFYDFRLNFETILICFFGFRHDFLFEDIYLLINLRYINYSNMTSFLRYVDIRAIYRLYNLIRTCAANVTDFSVVNIHVEELSSAQIWQHILCATFSARVNINYRLPTKVCYRTCTLRHNIRI
jgi:hypothetical protein